MGISSQLGSSALLPAGLGFRNILINGDFRVAQRGTSFVSGANNDDTYNLDRWTVLSDGNDIVDITQATDVPTGGLYSIGLDVETVNKKFGIIQFVEQQNIAGVQNQTVQLSFKARATGSSISNVKAVVLAWTGTADTVTSDVVSAWGADGVTPTWATNWTAENTPSNLGVTNTWNTYRVSALCDASAIKNLAVFIWCDDTSTTLGDFLYITDVQLEQNVQPTPFERRPYGVELQLCQRYYYRHVTGTGKNVYFGVYYSSAGFEGLLTLPVTMRATPTIDYAQGTNYYSIIGTSTDVSSYIFFDSYSTNTMVALYDNATASGTAGQAAFVITASASAYLGFSSEL